jgi:hypothetical protein
VLLATIILTGCQGQESWEYKVVAVSPKGNVERTGAAAFSTVTITPSDSELDALGAEGWELVTSYLEMESAYPNFGDEKYVTGLQPNVRPQRVILIFKRHSQRKKS